MGPRQITGWIDQGLNEKAYIIPGLGDFGERRYVLAFPLVLPFERAVVDGISRDAAGRQVLLMTDCVWVGRCENGRWLGGLGREKCGRRRRVGMRTLQEHEHAIAQLWKKHVRGSVRSGCPTSCVCSAQLSARRPKSQCMNEYV